MSKSNLKALFERLDNIEERLAKVEKAAENPLLSVDPETGEVRTLEETPADLEARFESLSRRIARAGY